MMERKRKRAIEAEERREEKGRRRGKGVGKDREGGIQKLRGRKGDIQGGRERGREGAQIVVHE